jgi:hypothetical protein
MYEQPPQTFTEVVAPFPQQIREVAERLRGLLLSAFPVLDEGIHGGTKVATALYSVGAPDRVALGIQPGPRFVKLFIHDPEHLPDTEFKLEGKGKHMRHIKLTSLPESTTSALLDLARVPVERRAGRPGNDQVS